MGWRFDGRRKLGILPLLSKRLALVSYAASLAILHRLGVPPPVARIPPRGNNSSATLFRGQLGQRHLHSARREEPKRAAQPPAAHASPRVVCCIYSSVRTAASGSERPPAKPCSREQLHTEQLKQRGTASTPAPRDTRDDERPRDGPLGPHGADQSTADVLDRSHGARAPAPAATG